MMMMAPLGQIEEIMYVCQEIHQTINSDFMGLACYGKDQKEIRWRYVFGNQSSKWKRMTIRFGKGMAGRVFQTGSPITYTHSSEEDAMEYPIILAEKLEYAIAYPITVHHEIWGVLLFGFRTHQEGLALQQDKIKDSIRSLELAVNSSKA
ncbi:GAF domain-containing protein [Bacillus sp. AK128]